MWSRYPEGADDEAVPGLAPADELAKELGPPQIVEVDGERFAVRSDRRGGTHYDWLTGLNPGYGFSSSPTADLSVEEHCDDIRTFLAQIDPDTGYLADD